MKNTLVVLFFFVFVLPAAAQVTSTSSRNIREGIRQTIQQQIQSARENFQKTMETKRVELQNTIQAHRDELRAKLQNIKDERKKTAVERIDQNLTNLNSRLTTHYANVLNQIEDVLKRVVSRTDTAQANSRDVTAVRTAIMNAQNAIATARAAVAAQVSKIYSLNITGDATLKKDVGAARQALHGDLKKVGDTVKAARDAVRQAAVGLAQIRGVDELKTPISTATSTSQ